MFKRYTKILFFVAILLIFANKINAQNFAVNNDTIVIGPSETAIKNVINNDVLNCDVYVLNILTTLNPITQGAAHFEGNMLLFTPVASYYNTELHIQYSVTCNEETKTAFLVVFILEKNNPVNVISNTDCYEFMPSNITFGIKEKFSTSKSYAIDGFTSPLVGDLNGDGKPEIVIVGLDNTYGAAATSTINCRYINIYNGQTGALKIRYDLGETSVMGDQYHRSPSMIALADLDNDGIGEIIVCQSKSGKVRALKPVFNGENITTLNEMWVGRDNSNNTVSFAAPLSIGSNGRTPFGYPMPYIADLNGDGFPEVIVYNKIYNGRTGRLLMSWGGTAASPVASNYSSTTFGLVASNYSTTPCTQAIATAVRSKAMIGMRRGNTPGGFADRFLAVPAITDIDGDGKQEIIVGNRIYKFQFNSLTDHTQNTYTTIEGPASATIHTNPSNSTTSTFYLSDGFTRVADIDGDGVLDIIVVGLANAGASDCNILVYVWNYQNPSAVKAALTYYSDGEAGNFSMPFIGDLNGKNDKWNSTTWSGRLPEICILSGAVYIDRNTATNGRSGIKFHPLSDPILRMGTAASTGTAAGWDNNQASNTNRKFNKASSTTFGGHIIGLTYNAQATEIDERLQLSFAMEHADRSDNTGITLFDFDNNGTSDMCYRDERTLRVISPAIGNNGSGIDYITLNDDIGTGSPIMFKTTVYSGTGYEYPTIADVNLDGSADILVTNNKDSYDYSAVGGYIKCFEYQGQKWTPAPPVWNQGMYDPTQIRENLQVNAIPSSYLTAYQKNGETIQPLNGSLIQQPIVMYGMDYLPIVRLPNAIINDVTMTINGGQTTITITVANTGNSSIGASAPIAFYDGGSVGLPIEQSTLIHVMPIGVDVFPNQTVTITYVHPAPLNDKLIWVRIFDDGVNFPAEGFAECDPANNSISVSACNTLVVNLTSEPSTIICGADGIVTLTATGNFSSSSIIEWYRNAEIIDGATDFTYVATTPGAYRCRIFEGPVCREFSTVVDVTLTYNVPTAAIVTSGDVLTCAAGSQNVSLNASGGDAYLWGNDLGANLGTNPTLVVNAPGTYTVTVTRAINGCTSSASKTIIQNINTPDVQLSTNTGTLTCTTTSIQVTATGLGTFAWSNNLSSTNIGNTSTVNITQAGTYTVTLTATNGCISTANVVIDEDKVIPTVSLNPTTGTLTCTTTNILVTAIGSGNLLWDGGIFTGSTVAAINISEVGIYTVSITNPLNGCVGSASININSNNAAPTATITAPSTELTCTQSSLPLTANGGSGYVWNTGSTASSIIATTAGIYTVTVTNSENGCMSTTNIGITSNTTPPTTILTNITNETTLTCNTQSILLSADSNDGSASYLWSTGATGNAITITSPGTYSVSAVGANGCVASGTGVAIITIDQNITNPNANITTTANELNCVVLNTTLTASGTGNFVWTGSATGSTILGTYQTFQTNIPDTYTVVITNPISGCTASASKVITQNLQTPQTQVNPTSGVLTCTNTSISITAIGGGDYEWNYGASTNATVVATAPGTYTVVATSPITGCTNTASAVISQEMTAPIASITPASGIITCSQPTVSVTANGGLTDPLTFAWSNNLGTNSTVNISQAGNYTVTVTNTTNGCTSLANVSISNNISQPTVSINNSTNILTCTNTEITLTAIGSGNFIWNNGSTSSAITVDEAGTYTVILTNSINGCQGTASIVITENTAIPDVSITPTSGQISCLTTAIQVTASSTTTDVNYLWSNNLGFNQEAEITASGLYTVTVTNPINGCTAFANINITQNLGNPSAIVTPTTAVLTCSQPTVDAIATGGGNYSWNYGLGNVSNVTISAPGVYIVTVTNPANGCTSTATISVTEDKINPNANVAPTSAVLTCSSPSVNVIASGGLTGSPTFAWSGGLGTAASVNISTTGIYTVTVTNSTNGCSETAQVSVTENKINPTVTINPASGTLTCMTTQIPVIASSSTPNATYVWDGSLGNFANPSISLPGNYTVTVTNPVNGCTNSAIISISQDINPPTVNITSDRTQLLCNDGGILLTATGGGTYQWNSGEISATILANMPFIYIVTVTNTTTGCTNSESLEITSIVSFPELFVTQTPNTTELNCNVPSIILTATGPNSSEDLYSWGYSWSTGGQSLEVTSPGTYTVTVELLPSHCTATQTVNITQNNNIPPISIIKAPETTVINCYNPEIQLTADANGSSNLLWTNGLGTNPSITVSQAGIYSVQVTNPLNGCANSANVEITDERETITAQITPNTGTLTCSTTYIDVVASGANSYQWTNNLSTNENLHIINTGVYTVTATNTSTGCLGTASITISEDMAIPSPSITTSGNETTITCTNSISGITLTAFGGGNYLWNSGASTATINITEPNTYTVTVTNPTNGCTASANVNINQNVTIPNVSVSTPIGTLTCVTTSIQVTANGNGTYHWSHGLGDVSTVNITSPNTYTVSVTNPENGCVGSAQVVIGQYISNPTASVNPTSAVLNCNTPSGITVTASGGGNYLWSNSLGNTNIVVINEIGTYIVTVTNPSNGCTASASVSVSEDLAIPTVSISSANETLTCTTAFIEASAIGQGNLLWSDGLGSGETVYLTSAGTYTVTITNPTNGCTSSTSIVVNSNTTTPSASVTPATATLTCSQLQVQVVANGGGTYSWNHGYGTSPVIWVNSVGTHTVTVTNPTNGCTNTATVTVYNNTEIPTASVTPATATLTCSQPNILATAISNNGTDFEWSDNLGFSQTATISQSGTYSVTITDLTNGCTNSASISVYENIATPIASITPSTTIINCITDYAILQANGGGSYLWNNGASTSSITVTTAGTYTVTVTNSVTGCTNSASITIDSDFNQPAVSIMASSETINCSTTSVQLIANGGGNYLWNTGPYTGSPSTASLITVSSPATYSVTVTNPANGCTNSASVDILVNTTEPELELTTNTNTITCTNPVVTASIGSNVPVTYSWSNNLGTNSTADISTPGTYNVTILNPANGCTATTSIIINENTTVPTASIIPNEAELTCAVTSVNLTAVGGGTYSWNNGASTSTIAATISDVYTVIVTNSSNGCTALASITVGLNNTVPLVSILKQPDITAFTCNNTIITLTAIGGTSYEWTGSIGNQSPYSNVITVTQPGNYTVTVTDMTNGCTNSAAANITANYVAPDVTILHNGSEINCLTTEIQLTANVTNSNATFIWSNSVNSTQQTSADIIVNDAGIYTVVATNPLTGCTSTANVEITVNTEMPFVSIEQSALALTCDTLSITLTASVNENLTWTGGVSTGLTTAAIILSIPDTYTVSVTNPVNYCSTSASVTIEQFNEQPNVSLSQYSATLTCDLTSVEVTATGDGDVIFSWNNGLGTDSVVTISSANTYTVVVSDTINGCTNSASINVASSADIPEVTITTNSNATELTCDVEEIILTANCIVGDSFVWYYEDNEITGETSNTITVSQVGTYSVVGIVSATGCSNANTPATVTITSNTINPTILISSSPSSELNCITTQITLTASGANTYTWIGQNTSFTATGSSVTISTADIYTVVGIITATGCSNADVPSTIEITQNTENPNTSFVNLDPNPTIDCNTSQIVLTATGGASYIWNDGSTLNPRIISTPGTYTVSAIGANGCTATPQNSASITINGYMATPQVTIFSQTTELNCNTQNITLTATAGYQNYAWARNNVLLGSNNVTLQISTAGNYSVTVTNEYGCTNYANISVTQNITVPTVSISTTANELNCVNQAITLLATGADTYIWTGNFGTSQLSAITVTQPGTYTVVGTNNSNGCSNNDNVSITITQAPQLKINHSFDPIKCFGNVTTLTITAAGGTLPYNGTGVFVVNAGTYNYTVTDNGGCSVNTGAINIAQPQQLNISVINTSEIICSGSNTTLIVTATGGTMPYVGTGSFEVGAGTHQFTVTDANICNTTKSITVAETEQIVINVSQIKGVSCFGMQDASIQVNATGGAGALSYIWNDANNTENKVLSNIGAGTYTVSITDELGCTNSYSYIVKSPENIGIIANISDVVCYGEKTGIIRLNGQGGTSPYTYSITNSTFSSNIRVLENLAAGLYQVRIMDINKCSFDTIINIKQPEQIVAYPTVVNPSCIDAVNGTINFNIYGGTEPYTFYVTDNQSDHNYAVTRLKQGTYNVIIEDYFGCKLNVNRIELIAEEGECLKIPNCITPNGDGINDTWVIDGLENFDNVEIFIFNRWGQKLFESPNYEKWNGMYKNNKVPTGTYLYVINIYGEKKYAGTLTVVY